MLLWGDEYQNMHQRKYTLEQNKQKEIIVDGDQTETIKKNCHENGATGTAGGSIRTTPI